MYRFDYFVATCKAGELEFQAIDDGLLTDAKYGCLRTAGNNHVLAQFMTLHGYRGDIHVVDGDSGRTYRGVHDCAFGGMWNEEAGFGTGCLAFKYEALEFDDEVASNAG